MWPPALVWLQCVQCVHMAGALCLRILNSVVKANNCDSSKSLSQIIILCKINDLNNFMWNIGCLIHHWNL